MVPEAGRRRIYDRLEGIDRQAERRRIQFIENLYRYVLKYKILSRWPLAHASAEKEAAAYAKILLKEYIKGRGRYGSTPHPLTTTVHFVFQERDKLLESRARDPLEWLRSKLRNTQAQYTKNAESVYEEMRSKRPVKQVY